MKKKNKKIIIICLSILFLFMLIPIKDGYWDGGTKVYKAFLYKIFKVHRLNDNLEEFYQGYTYIEGTVVEILGIKVYDDTKLIKEEKNQNCPTSPNDINKAFNDFFNLGEDEIKKLGLSYVYDITGYYYVDSEKNKVIVGIIDLNEKHKEQFISILSASYNMSCIYDIKNKDIIEFREAKNTIDGIVIELRDNSLVLEVLGDTKSLKKGDIVITRITNHTSGRKNKYKLNDKVKITYSGIIETSNPPQIGAIKIENYN